MGFPGGSEVKASASNAGDPGSIPGLGRSPGEGNGNPLQYSCLEDPMDGGAWWSTVHGVAKSQTQLSDFTYTFTAPTNLCYHHIDAAYYCSMYYQLNCCVSDQVNNLQHAVPVQQGYIKL